MRFGVLGPLRVQSGGTPEGFAGEPGADLGAPTHRDAGELRIPGAKERLLLGVLISEAGSPVSADRLIDELWGEHPPPSAAKTLQAYVVRVRSALEPDRVRGSAGQYVVRSGTGYLLTLDGVEIDARTFADDVVRARALVECGRTDEAAQRVRHAFNLWRGEPYADWPEAEFAEAQRARVHELRLLGVETLADAEIAAGRPELVLPLLQQATREHRFREGLWARLACALYASSRQADALAALREVRDLLGEELGVDPGPELRELEEAILAQEALVPVQRGAPALVPAGPPPTAPVAPHEVAPELRDVCPYKGLKVYEEDDAAAFYGRDRLAASLVTRLLDRDVLVVSGPSGAGKSSLVRAGVVPRVRDALPAVTAARVLTPGAHPTDALAAAVPLDETGPVVLVVDQLEEVWTGGASTSEQRAFFDEVLGLLDDGRVARVVAVVRGDHLGRLAEHPEFAERAGDGLVLVPPMSADELTQAVIGPAARVGLAVDDELVSAVVADVQGQVAPLPLLSTALVETWQRRRDGRLTLSGYLEAGGVHGALARAAEDAYASLDSPARDRARGVLLRLVETGAGGAPVRRRVPLVELALESPARAHVVETFVQRRLLAVDDERLEVAHEALFTAWPRFATWIEEDGAGRAIRRHLSPAAAEWDRRGRPVDELYRGARLAAALDWATRDGGRTVRELTDAERDFLAASEQQAGAELAEAQQRAEREATARQRTHRLAVGLAAMLVVAVVAGTLAAFQSVVADRRADAATEARLLADANALAARASTVAALDTSLLLAAQAVRMADTPATQDGLLSALVRHRQALGVSRAPVGTRPLDVAVSPDGQWVYSALNVGGLVRWNALDADGPEPVELPGGEDWLLEAVPGPVGSSLLGVAGERGVHVLGRDRQPALFVPREQIGGLVHDLVFDPTGQRLVLSMWPGREDPPTSAEVVTVDVATGAVQPTGVVETGDDRIEVRLNDDGAGAVVTRYGESPQLTYLDLVSGVRVPLAVEPRRGTWLNNVTALPIGVLALWGDGAMTLFNPSTGQQVQHVAGHTANMQAAVLTSDAKTLVTVADDRRVAVWDVDTGAPDAPLRLREILTGQRGRVVDVALSQDGRRAYTSSLDGTLAGWDLSDKQRFGEPVPAPIGHGFFGRPAGVGDVIVAATRPLTGDLLPEAAVAAAFLDSRTGELLGSVPLGDTVPRAGFGASVAASPDGRHVVVTSGYRASVLDVASRRVVREIELPERTGDPEIVWSALWSADGGRIYLGTEGTLGAPEDGSVVVVNARTLREEARIETGDVQSLALSPDGEVLAVGSEELGKVVLVDAASGEVRRELQTTDDGAVFGVAFSPDGQYLAAASWNGHLYLWDADSGKPVRDPVRLHPGFVLQVDWLDDTTVVTTGTDGYGLLYDVERDLVRGQPLPAFADGGDGWASAVVTEERELLLLGQDRAGRRYPLRTGAWLAHACLVASRDLTDREWQSYLPGHRRVPTCGDLD